MNVLILYHLMAALSSQQGLLVEFRTFNWQEIYEQIVLSDLAQVAPHHADFASYEDG